MHQIIKIIISILIIYLIQFILFYNLFNLSMIICLIVPFISILSYFLYELLKTMNLDFKRFKLSSKLSSITSKHSMMNHHEALNSNKLINVHNIEPRRVTFNDQVQIKEISDLNHHNDRSNHDLMIDDQMTIDSNPEIEIEIDHTKEI